MRLLKSRGQSTGEYAILFAIVLGAVIGMQNYIRNQIAGALKNEADEFRTATGSGDAVTIDRTSDSLAASRTAMTDANTGSVRSDSASAQVTTVNP